MIGLVGRRALDAAWRAVIVATVIALGACREQRSDARIQAKYDDDGKLQLLTYDSNGNGTPDMWSHMDGTRVVRIDIDKNEDGVIERREYYDARQKLEKVELSTRPDGRVTRTEFYDSGVLTRAEEDVDGNGALDRWETYTNGLVRTVAFDLEGAGRPTRRFVYGDDGQLIRIETGTDLIAPAVKR